MNKYISSLLFATAAVGLASCNDYLDREPEDKIIPENFFNSEANLKAYTLNFYTMFPSHSDDSYALGTFSSDNGTDNQVSSSVGPGTMWVPGEWRVGQGTENWSFGNIRSLNYFINNVKSVQAAGGSISGSESGINQAIGEAYFFRAFSYWNGYKAIGDYPIIDDVLPNDKEFLLEKSVRYPRNQVARHILADLDTAIMNLPDVSDYGKNGLTKNAARLFRSRVALFEGTWLKYHKGTALVPGGPKWPGNAAMLGDFNIDTESSFFLSEAMKSGKEVGDQFVNNLVENTATREGMGHGFTIDNPYYCMFAIENPGTYDEVLMYRSYSLSQNLATQIQNQFQQNAGGTGWTRGMVNSFVMANGLPIYATGSGYDPNWENLGVDATLQGRDSRLIIFSKGDSTIMTYGMSGSDDGRYSMDYIFSNDRGTKCSTGFAIKKGQDYDYAQLNGNLQSTTGSITFRAVEAMLNYMEACVELNGSVDGTADGYWRAIRTRAKVNPDYMITVNATEMDKEALGDWGAYSHGQLVGKLLYNVRRERRNELCAEARRLDDLRRWCALDQMITTPYQIEGIKYWGTVYADPTSKMYILTPDGTAPVVDISSGKGNVSPQENSDYFRPYQVTTVNNLGFNGLRFTRAHYLNPIGHNVFVYASPDKQVANSVVYQNPGWPTEGGQPASNLD